LPFLIPAASVSVLMVHAAVALSPCSPEDHAEVGPDRRVLVGEHDHLHAVVRHVPGEVLVNLDHGTAEVFAIAAHSQFRAGIGRPLWEDFSQLLVVPGKKEVAKFVVVNCIGIGRVGDPEIAGFAEIAGIGEPYL
jgi:hypothetical protein